MIGTHNGSLLCAKADGTLHARSTCPNTLIDRGTREFSLVERDDVIDDLGFSNVTHQAQIGTHTWTYQADLRVPTPAGETVIPSADVTITYDPVWGGVESVTGTAGMPILPSGSGCGLWCSSRLGYNPTTTSPMIEIGFGKPGDWNHFELPLKDSRRYFYLLLQSGHGAEWGNYSISTPDSGAMQIVLDHRAPTIFFFTDFPFGLGELTGPLESVGFGASRGRQIPFEANRVKGVETYMDDFDGELYLGGAVNISPIEGLNLVLDSDVIMDVNTAAFVDDLDFIDKLGYNGELTYGADLGPFSVEFYAGHGSIYYRKSSSLRRLAMSGVLDPERPLDGLPFQMDDNAELWGQFDDDFSDGEPSFVHLEGELDFNNKFTQQKIEGSVEISENGGSFDGRARFAGTAVEVSGAVYSSYARFSGSITNNWNISAGKIKTTITASFDSRDAEVELDVRAQFCALGKCDSISGSASVNGSGQIRVCARVPKVGEKCDTLG